jgi:ArsR family transcriptional regulator
MDSRLLAQPPATCSIPCADLERVAEGRAHLLDETTYDELAAIFRALGDPTRAKIVYRLLHQSLCTCDPAELTGISESAVYNHAGAVRLNWRREVAW